MVSQGEVTRLRSLVRQKESEVEQVSEVAAKLNRERDNISDIVRQEFADRYHHPSVCLSLMCTHTRVHAHAYTHIHTHTYNLV